MSTPETPEARAEREAAEKAAAAHAANVELRVKAACAAALAEVAPSRRFEVARLAVTLAASKDPPRPILVAIGEEARARLRAMWGK